MQDVAPLFVSIIVPCRNEVSHITRFLEAVFRQSYGNFEVIVADGASDDGTRQQLERLMEVDPRLVVVDNPARYVSNGLNQAIGISRGAVIVRMDVHTEYAEDYVERCLSALQSSSADNVGGPWRALGRGYMQSAIALAFQSPFSSGGASSHRMDYAGPVDSVYLGCWPREAFTRFGLFDEELVRNQDDELNLRILRGGGRVWQSPDIRSWYYPRASLARLFSQYAQYGYWKVRVIQKHRLPASVRHLVPGAFVAGLGLLGAAAPFSPWALGGFVILALAYSVGNGAASLLTCMGGRGLRYLPVMPLVFAAFHFGYGYGFLRGFVEFVLLRRGGNAGFSTLTR
jgi:glycosyltransferase involved in cell wall biosynthesis